MLVSLDPVLTLRVQVLDPRELFAKTVQAPLGRNQYAGDAQRQPGRNKQPTRIHAKRQSGSTHRGSLSAIRAVVVER